jgi:alanyl-tRNA synthetase
VSAGRLYYSDSFLRRFSARVSGVRPASADAACSRLEVALDRTAFYPTSGGQPFDIGRLRVWRGNAIAAEAAVESVVEDADGEVWHTVDRPIAPGSMVEGEIDWDRRLDHMQQHTGQHLLSALCWSQLQAPTVSFHMGESISNIDLAGGAVSGMDLARIEVAANQIVAEDRPITVRQVERSEAEALLAAGKLRKLPDRAGPMRLIEIADCDLNACGGTHLRSTGQIGGLRLRGVEKISRGVRIQFSCGLRAVRTARADAALLAQAAQVLSVAAADLPAAIERLTAEAKASEKCRTRLAEALATVEGANMAAAAELRDGFRLVVAGCRDRDRDYVRLLASRAAAAAPRTIVILSSGEDPFVRVLLARSPDLDLHCGAILKEVLAERGLRGGGSPDLAQGEIARAAADDLRAALAARVHARLAPS